VKRPLSPADIRAPFARYSHGVALPADARLVFCSGQVGAATDDTIPDSVTAQAEICFENIRKILAEADLGLADIVRINAFVTKREHLKEYMAVRDRYISDPPPASTLVIVTGFTRPEFLVEVEVVAAGQA
jgi:2-iminobutanoate/2-iminopropanoate deaminase